MRSAKCDCRNTKERGENVFLMFKSVGKSMLKKPYSADLLAGNLGF